jgi:phosphoribosylaminoimidazolecarboxamide formyltransferase/IMP cyclohydrolase
MRQAPCCPAPRGCRRGLWYDSVMKTALLASYGKDDALLRLGDLLQKHGWNLLGSAGTAKFLSGSGIPCRDVAEIVGPPILGHRVVTLARKVYAALLATPADFGELDKINVQPISLVYVTLYPLEDTIAKGGSPDEVIEKTDIGGPTLLRAAAKGRRITLSNPAQIDELEAWLHAGASEKEREKLVLKFAAAAERRVADYVSASADYWERQL